MMDTLNKPRRQKRSTARPEERRRVTMTDVARAVGCSQATVSLALNQVTGIKLSKSLRDKVFAAARELGYVLPNAQGLDGARNSDGIIAFVVDQLATSPEAVVAIEGARQASWEAGNVVVAAQTLSDPQMELRTLRALTGRGTTGLIYMAIFTRQLEAPPILDDLDMPVVLLNCYTADDRFPSVVPGEVAGGQTATRHLIAQGHRRIATITGEPWMDAAKDRLKGYRHALAAAEIVYEPQLVIEGDWSASAGYEATVQLLALEERPTAIFCQNDRTAIGCYEALKEAGLAIPTDMSVVGYDDEEISRHLHPQLTTVVLPHRAMGQWAVEQLARGRQQGQPHAPVKLACTLVERNSVGKR
jgi:LacI family transcriptional regulator